MTTQRIAKLPFFFFLLLSSFAWADTQELNSLIATLRAQNPELVALRHRIEAARQRVPQERSLMDPMIGADIEGVPTKKFSYNDYMNIEYMVSQQIPFPGKLRLKGKMAEQEAAMLEKEYQAREQEIVLEFKRIYFQRYLIGRSIQINKENRELVDQMSKIAQAKYATGQVAQQDAIKAQVELAKLVNELVTLEQEKEINLAMANTFLARDLDQEISVPDSLGTEVPIFEWDPLVDQTLGNRPELLAMGIAKERAKTAVRLARKEFWPDFQIKAEARQFNEEHRIREMDTFFGVNLPIWFLSKQRAGLREKKAELSATEAAYHSMQNMALLELQEGLIGVQAKQRIAELYTTTLIPQARQAMSAAKASYETDKTDFLNWIDAQRTLKEMQLEQEQAVVELHQSLAQLERALGGAWPEERKVESREWKVESWGKDSKTVIASEAKQSQKNEIASGLRPSQ